VQEVKRRLLDGLEHDPIVWATELLIFGLGQHALAGELDDGEEDPAGPGLDGGGRVSG